MVDHLRGCSGAVLTEMRGKRCGCDMGRGFFIELIPSIGALQPSVVSALIAE